MNTELTTHNPAASVTGLPGQTSLQGSNQPPLAQPPLTVGQTSLANRKCENLHKLLDASIRIVTFVIGHFIPEKGFWLLFPLVCVLVGLPGQTSLQGNDQPPLAQPPLTVGQTREDRKCENLHKLLDASIRIATFVIGHFIPEKGFWLLFPFVCVFSFYIAYNKSREEAPTDVIGNSPAENEITTDPLLPEQEMAPIDVIGNYLAKNKIPTNTLLTEQQIRELKFPELEFAQKTLVTNSLTTEEMEARGQQIGHNSEKVRVLTNVLPQNHGRRVVNMSGKKNLCGYRAVLSQVDPDCADVRLANPYQGGTESMSPRTLAKVNELLLAIAVGRAKSHPRDVQEAGSLRQYLESQMKALIDQNGTDAVDSAGGELGAEDLRYLPPALGIPIILIEGSQNGINIREGHLKKAIDTIEETSSKLSHMPGQIERMASMTTAERNSEIKKIDKQIARLGKSKAPSALKKARSDLLTAQKKLLNAFIGRDAARYDIEMLKKGGATLRIYAKDGDYFALCPVLVDDPKEAPSDANNPEAMKTYTAAQKQYFLEQSLESDAIVLFNEVGNHYMAVQKSSQTL
jgi:hypothetical protein